MRQHGCSGCTNPQIFGTSPFAPNDFEASSTMCTRCFETQTSPGCTCTRRSKFLTHSLTSYGRFQKQLPPCNAQRRLSTTIAKTMPQYKLVKATILFSDFTTVCIQDIAIYKLSFFLLLLFCFFTRHCCFFDTVLLT